MVCLLKSNGPNQANPVWAVLTPSGHRDAFAYRALRNISPHRGRSVRLDAGGLDHLGPLLSFLADELTKIGRRVLGRTNAKPSACLEARQELTDGRDVWQPLPAGRGGHRQRPQLASAD